MMIKNDDIDNLILHSFIDIKGVFVMAKVSKAYRKTIFSHEKLKKKYIQFAKIYHQIKDASEYCAISLQYIEIVIHRKKRFNYKRDFISMS